MGFWTDRNQEIGTVPPAVGFHFLLAGHIRSEPARHFGGSGVVV